LKTVKVKISDIKANPNNPRLIKDDKFAKLVQSVTEFPEMLEIRPIVVNSEMVVLGGNMRLKACKEAKIKELTVIIADNLTEEQQREFLIKDNVSGGEWDWEVLANEWDSEQLEDWGLDVPDFGADTELLEAEQKDLSGDLKETFEVIISCNDETHQEQVYNKMIADGFNVRVLTL
jgi:ParB-like chromosome segregation protein Spo0J